MRQPLGRVATPAAPTAWERRNARWRATAIAAWLLLFGSATRYRAAPSLSPWRCTNASEPVLCAERDNVTVNLTSGDVRTFRIEAAHPAYIGTLQRDSFEADWTGCTAPGDPDARVRRSRQSARRSTRTIELWVVGLTFHDFWRPADEQRVRIGDRRRDGRFTSCRCG